MPSRRINANHDAAWKQFFALPIAVEHLLVGFFPEVAAWLDLETLRDAAGEWVGDGRRRRADSVWRADYRDGTGRSLVLLLEFQSTVDPDMPARVHGMLGLAHRRARRAGATDQGRQTPDAVRRDPCRAPEMDGTGGGTGDGLPGRRSAAPDAGPLRRA